MAEPTTPTTKSLEELKAELVAKRDEHQALYNKLWDKTHPKDAACAALNELIDKRDRLATALDADPSLADALNPKIEAFNKEIAAAQLAYQEAVLEDEKEQVTAELEQTQTAITRMTASGQPLEINAVKPGSTMSLKPR